MGTLLSVYAIHHLAADIESERRLQKIVTLDNYECSMTAGTIDFEKADREDSRKCIHLTFDDQTDDKIEKFFFGVKVIVLDLDLKKLNDRGFHLVEESNKPGGNRYPHLYHRSGELTEFPGIVSPKS